ncbi:MAG: hypothetical protein JNL58_28845 [Planctomyces sp.]|nr:hypothetical protein [Planctomyces sp.]
MSESSSSQLQSPWKRMVVSFVVAEFMLVAGNLLLRILQRGEWLSAWAYGAFAIASAIPMVWFAIRFFRMLRSEVDEMIQRIVLEGLAFAFVVFVPLAGLYVNARTAGLISLNLDPPEILLIPSILAMAGVLISWSRLK